MYRHPLIKDKSTVNENGFISNLIEKEDLQNNNNGSRLNDKHADYKHSQQRRPLLSKKPPDNSNSDDIITALPFRRKSEMITSYSDPYVLESRSSPKIGIRTRRVSLPGPNKHVFTVHNYGNTEVKDIIPVVDEIDDNSISENGDSLSGDNDMPLQELSVVQNGNQHSEEIEATDGVPSEAVNSNFSNNSVSSNNNNSKSPVKNKILQNIITTECPDRRTSYPLFKPSKKSKWRVEPDVESTVSFNGNDEHLKPKGKVKKNNSFLRPSDASSVTSQSHLDKMSRSASVAQIASLIAHPIRDVIRRGRAFGKRKRDRLILKNGAVNLSSVHVKKKNLRFFQDMFTTLVDIKWRYMLLLLASAFIGTWIGFALIWWAVCAYQIKNGGPECVSGVYDFDSALLFSVETQHTIGYGTRAVTTDCRLAIFFVMLQSLIGVTMSCVTTGLVFAKFARPRRRAETLLFSKNSVIFENKGVRYLAFRLGDIRRSHMIQASVQAVLFSHESGTDELPFHQHNLHVESEAENLYFLAWPVVISHTIDKNSPLWNITEENLLFADFEIVVVFEGTNSSTGQSTQICTSYLPSEIIWGANFAPLISGRNQGGQYLIDYEKFNSTIPFSLDARSAKEASVKGKDINDNIGVIPEIRVNIENEIE